VKNNLVRLKFGFREKKNRARDPQTDLPGTGLWLRVDIIEKIYISVFEMRV
jgi:hypothetical protein